LNSASRIEVTDDSKLHVMAEGKFYLLQAYNRCFNTAFNLLVDVVRMKTVENFPHACLLSLMNTFTTPEDRKHTVDRDKIK
jgi:hypothetical protein